MGMTWQVQEAKNRFSEMLERARSEGPQVITRHGRSVARVVATDALGVGVQSQSLATDGFANYLLSAPKVGDLEAPVRRSRKAAVTLGG
jgi:antitoxin Phd